LLVKKYLLLFIILSCCANPLSTSDSDIPKTNFVNSEDVLVEILDSYKNYSKNPEKSIDVIWNFAHPSNKEVTGPKDNFERMLLSDPYSSILDLKEYSITKTIETENNDHYKIKILAKNNSYFEVTWVFQLDECPENPAKNCWLTIAVTAPSYYESGV
jgi:hypothetical protein